MNSPGQILKIPFTVGSSITSTVKLTETTVAGHALHLRLTIYKVVTIGAALKVAVVLQAWTTVAPTNTSYS